MMYKLFTYTLLIATMYTMGCTPTDKIENGDLPDAPYIILPNNDLKFTGWVGVVEEGSHIAIAHDNDHVNFENLVVIFSIFSYNTESSIEWCKKNEEYVNKVKAGVKRHNNNSAYIGGRAMPIYAYGITRNIEVYADAKLWGIEAGQNLSEHFELPPNNYPFILYESATPLAECQCKDSPLAPYDLETLSSVLLPLGVLMSPKSIPEEQPQEITFTISITISPSQTYDIIVNRVKLSY